MTGSIRRACGALLAAVTVTALAPGTSQAGIQFFEGSPAEATLALSITNQSAVNPVLARTQQTIDGSPVAVTISRLSGFLNANGTNISSSNSVGNPLQDLKVNFASGFGARVFEFSVLAGSSGTLSFRALDQLNVLSPATNFSISSGTTKYYALVDGDSLLTGLELSTSTSLINQVKMLGTGGVTRIGPGAVPEPGTLGLGLVGALTGLGLARYRRRNGGEAPLA